MEEYYADIVGTIGSHTSAAADLNKAASSIAQSLEAQYQSQAGVNLDEEPAGTPGGSPHSVGGPGDAGHDTEAVKER